MDIPRLKLIEKECQLALLVDGKVDCMLQVLEALDLDLVAVAEVDDECLFFGGEVLFGGEFKFFLGRANRWGCV